MEPLEEQIHGPVSENRLFVFPGSSAWIERHSPTLGGRWSSVDVHFAVAKCIYIELRSMNVPLRVHPQSATLLGDEPGRALRFFRECAEKGEGREFKRRCLATCCQPRLTISPGPFRFAYGPDVSPTAAHFFASAKKASLFARCKKRTAVDDLTGPVYIS